MALTHERGYILEWRKEPDSKVWNHPDLRVQKVWKYLKLCATHTGGHVWGNDLNPGDVLTSYSGIVAGCNAKGVDLETIPEAWRFSYKTVRRIVNEVLIRDFGYLRKRRALRGGGMILSIVGWSDHQNQGRGRAEVGQSVTDVAPVEDSDETGAEKGPSRAEVGQTQGRGRAEVGQHSITNPFLHSEGISKGGGLRAAAVPDPSGEQKKSEESAPSPWNEMVPLRRGAMKPPPPCPHCKKPLSYFETRSGSRYAADRWYCDEKAEGCGAKFPEVDWEDPGEGKPLRRKQKGPRSDPKRDAAPPIPIAVAEEYMPPGWRERLKKHESQARS